MNHGKYIIDESKLLGAGGTAQVYFGINKNDGHQYAFKCSDKKLKNEICIMKKLDHKNFIKFYESLDDIVKYVKVIVIEYCNRGSLFEFTTLHQGLCDNMFLRMLECLHEGIFYLRSQRFVHRDIKLGNMMVSLDDMGYYHIKLGDLGAAKLVNDGETFASMVGTEEYLHPNMYHNLLDKDPRGHFKANMDLWSIAVSLYQAAVNDLPFTSFNYNRASSESKRALNRMYERKGPGIICGHQNSDNQDDITWSDQLPSKCRLSPTLRDMASKLIGNLMDLSGSMTYERFFEEAKVILRKKRVLIFDSVSGELQLLYLDSLSYDSVLNQILQLTHYPRQDTMVLTRNKRLRTRKDPGASCLVSVPVKGLFKYTLTDDTVLVVMTKPPKDVPGLFSPQLSISDCERPESSCHKAKKYSNALMMSIYELSRQANYVDCQIECYQATVHSFNEHVILDKACLMNEAMKHQMTAIRGSCVMTDSLVNITEQAAKDKCDPTTSESLAKCKTEIMQLRNKASEGEVVGDQYYTKIVTNQEMLTYTAKNFDKEYVAGSDENLEFLVHLAEQLVDEVKLLPEVKVLPEEKQSDEKKEVYRLEIWQRHIRQYKYYETSKVKLLAKRERIALIHESFFTWLRQALTITTRFNRLRDFMRQQDARRESLSAKFDQINVYVERMLADLDLEPPQLTFSIEDASR